MALTLVQRPTTPNVTGTNLLYTLTSDSSSLQEFRYVLQVYPTESSSFAYPSPTFKYYPNTTGSGIIDVANILDRYLAWDDDSQSWDAIARVSGTGDTAAIGSGSNSTIQKFNLHFGEEYFSGSGVVEATGSIVEEITVFQGSVDPNNGTSYNFDTASIATNNANVLTDMPEALYTNTQYDFLHECPKMNVYDYQTITVMKKQTGAYGWRVQVFTEDPATYYTGSLLLDYNDEIPEDLMICPFGSGNILNTSGIADKNILTGSSAAWLVFEQGDPAGYKPINFMLKNHSHFPCNKNYRNAPTAPAFPQIVNEYQRFVFQNKYGMWDFYSVYNTLQQTNRVDRKTYTKPFQIYNQQDSQYDLTTRGEKQFSSILTEQFTSTTDYVSKKTADWLTQLFDSNNVYLQIPDNVNDGFLEREYDAGFRAIIINNVNYRWQENKFRNKTFQFTIDWSFANKTFVY